MKRYTKPELIIISFKSQDIITVSAAGQLKDKINTVKFKEIDIF